MAGTSRYQAPELLSHMNDADTANTQASDVYAFALVCYEVSFSCLSLFDLF
jgi:serine/threonine protein kinase